MKPSLPHSDEQAPRFIWSTSRFRGYRRRLRQSGVLCIEWPGLSLDHVSNRSVIYSQGGGDTPTLRVLPSGWIIVSKVSKPSALKPLEIPTWEFGSIDKVDTLINDNGGRSNDRHVRYGASGGCSTCRRPSVLLGVGPSPLSGRRRASIRSSTMRVIRLAR